MSIPSSIRIKNKKLPETPGVYLMKDAKGEILYVGKAISLKKRVGQYFTHPHGAHVEEMVQHIAAIDYIEQPTVIEALILEANLIKLYQPKYNIAQKDNKSFLYLAITKDAFPKPVLIRGADLEEGSEKTYKALFGPYTSPTALRAALDLIRKIFPWSTCEPGQRRPCFYVHLKQCPGVCVNAIDQKAYGKIIHDLILFFQGKKTNLIKKYEREMKAAAKALKFEEATALRRKLFFLEHIQDVAVIKRDESVPATPPLSTSLLTTDLPAVNLFGRIEGYDISNISGTSSVGSMVVFQNGAPAKAEYRKFKIKTVTGSNDVASLQEVLFRLFHNPWAKPDLILIDGGLSQVHAAEAVLASLNLALPVIGIAKGPERKRNDLICSEEQKELCDLCASQSLLLEKVRDEAHRFAISYHRKVRGRGMQGA